MIKVKLNRLNIAPRKVRLVAKLLKGKSVETAESQLTFLEKRAAKPILKLIKAAVDAALKKELSKSNLMIKNIIINEGPKRKKMFPGSRGRAKPIIKRTSHIELTLGMKS